MATLMVGVSGVRGIVGESLTPAVALEFAQAYGTLLGRGRVVLARDTRPSGPIFAAAAKAGLLAAGCQVTDLGVVMTPTIGHAIRTGGYVGGMSITASHNPSEYNGLKFLDDIGVAPDPERAAEIARIRTDGAFKLVTSDFPYPTVDDQAGPQHAAAVQQACEVELAPLRGTKVVLDSINGAGCRDTPAFLQALGIDVIHLNGEPTGNFAHRPEPIAENLTSLGDAVRQHNAAIGFAQDPDADRLALVDENGHYIGEEYTLALSTWSVLSRRPGPVAANLSTSRMIDDIAAEHDCQVVRTPVGESHVARAMLAHDCVIGGEGNGGVIDPRICYVRDSLSAISLVLQLMAATGKRLSQLVEGLPRYASVKEKYECPRDRILTAVDAVTQAFADQQPNTADGVRIDFDAGWVHLRASNTEPIVRVIGEGQTDTDARQLVDRVKAAAKL
jgi:phosphomannomutase